MSRHVQYTGVLIPQDEGHTIVRNVGGYSANDSNSRLPINVLQINAVTTPWSPELLDGHRLLIYYMRHTTNVLTMADFGIIRNWTHTMTKLTATRYSSSGNFALSIFKNITSINMVVNRLTQRFSNCGSRVLPLWSF